MGKPIGYHPARLQRAFRISIYFPLNRGAKHPLTCAAQHNCVSSRHGKQADSDVLRRSAGSQPMGLPIGYGFTHDFALCRSAGAVRQFHRLRHAFSVQMVWYLSLTYGQAHRLSSGTPSARFSLRKLACRTIRMIRTIRTRAERG